MPTAEREKTIRRARGFTALLVNGVILIVGLAFSVLRLDYQAITG